MNRCRFADDRGMIKLKAGVGACNYGHNPFSSTSSAPTDHRDRRINLMGSPSYATEPDRRLVRTPTIPSPIRFLRLGITRRAQQWVDPTRICITNPPWSQDPGPSPAAILDRTLFPHWLVFRDSVHDNRARRRNPGNLSSTPSTSQLKSREKPPARKFQASRLGEMASYPDLNIFAETLRTNFRSRGFM